MESPLSKQQQADIKKSLYNLNELDRLIEKAKASGMDVSEWEARRDHLKQFLEAAQEHWVDKPKRP